MNVEKMKSEQAGQLAALAAEIWTEHFFSIIGEEQTNYMLEHFQSEPVIEEQIRTEACTYYGAYDDGRLIGYCACKPENDGVFISKLYVRRANRRQGFAHAMVDRILKDHPDCAFLRLTVNRKNHSSVEAYKRLGFQIEGELATDIGGGFAMDDYVMRLVCVGG